MPRSTYQPAPGLVDDTTHTIEVEAEEGLSAPSTFAALGLCQLNQWALDFDGNLERIMESIRQVKHLGGYYRGGPELEICGYSCDDHFNEGDTTAHCWQSIIKILRSDLTHNCLTDVGMPVVHKSVRYNCRIYMLNKEIILIRPKMFLANDGAYRETRWFGAWRQSAGLENFILPKSVQRLHGQQTCPFGFAAIQCNDCILAAETCEELFVPESPHLAMCLGGVDIFTNGSASYFETGKLKRRLDLILAPTQKMGGIYMYCNTKGNDGGQLAFDGTSFIACNGEVVSMIKPFQINDVEVLVERINVNKVRSFRACNPSFAFQANSKPVITLPANIWLSGVADSSLQALRLQPPPFGEATLKICSIPEELGRGVACWLWDMLRRSNAQGFLVCLGGDADSTAVAAMVCLMCHIVWESLEQKIYGVASDVERVLKMDKEDAKWPKSARELCYQILHTAHLSSRLSSLDDRAAAEAVAEQLASWHMSADIDGAVEAQLKAVESRLRVSPVSRTKGLKADNRLVHDLHSREKMVQMYLLASLVPSVRASDRLAPPPDMSEEGSALAVLEDVGGHLLTLSSQNMEGTIRGEFVKHGESSADINPLGAMSTTNIELFLDWAATELAAPILAELACARSNIMIQTPTDEPEGGKNAVTLKHTEIYILGYLRKRNRCGPVEMYELLCELWRTQGRSLSTPDLGEASPSRLPRECTQADLDDVIVKDFLTQALSPRAIAEKVKYFYRSYAANRHKSTTLPPSYHADAADGDASRYDWRPFMYPNFERQFRQIDQLVLASEHHKQANKQAAPGVRQMKPRQLPGRAAGSK